MADFSVRLVRYDEDGDEHPVAHRTVKVWFTSFFRGRLEEITDEDGVAYFEGDEGEIEVYFEGQSYGTHHFEDGGQITVCVS